MQVVSIHQAKDRFSALLQSVELGEEVVITRHGKKVARLIREEEADTSESEMDRLALEALDKLQALRAKVLPGPALPWKELRDTGRKHI